MTRAMLLCAGKGTRLLGLSMHCPKPLLPVCDIPILRYGVAKLVASGISNIVINLHHQGHLISEELGDGRDMGAHIQYSHEEKILGTGGGIKKALPLLDPDNIDEPILSMNGKLIFDLDIPALLQSFQESPQCLGMMVVQATPNAMEWGAVDLRPEGERLRVHNILGAGEHMFCGVHMTRPSVIQKIPEGEACTVRQGYLPWIQQGGRVLAFEHKGGYFAEHSTPKRYLQSNLDLLRGAKLQSPPPQPLIGVAASAQVDPTTTIISPVRIGEGVKIGPDCVIGPDVVVGHNSEIVAASTLRQCVVWPSVEFAGQAENEIITPSLRIATKESAPVET